jgi:putative flippase GtrA
MKFDLKRLTLEGSKFAVAGVGLTIFGYFLYLGILNVLPSKDFYLVAHFVSYVLHFNVSYVVHSNWFSRHRWN